MKLFDAVIHVPVVHKSKYKQRVYSIDLASKNSLCLEVDLQDAAEAFHDNCDLVRKRLEVHNDFYPNGFSARSWPGYCLAPHGYLPLGGSRFQVGLNLYEQFLHIDREKRTALLFDPGIQNAFLSTTNWVNSETGELWFASWVMEDTFRRALDPMYKVKGKIWTLSHESQEPSQIWEGVTGDSLHQLTVSPDRRFVVLCEFGVSPKHPCPVGEFDAKPQEWSHVLQHGLLPSDVLVLDLRSGQEWRLSFPAAAHVEFDQADPSICYLSSHNIGLIHGKVGIYGPGSIHAYRLKPDGPMKIGTFSCKDFFRITTHEVFRHRDRTLIGVTGYPGSIFLVDAEKMELYKTILLGNGEKISLDTHPHICTQDSYGITSLEDGELLFIAETGRCSIRNIHNGQTECTWNMEYNKDEWCFTGHIFKESCS